MLYWLVEEIVALWHPDKEVCIHDQISGVLGTSYRRRRLVPGRRQIRSYCESSAT